VSKQTIIDPELRELRLVERQRLLTQAATEILRDDAKRKRSRVNVFSKRSRESVLPAPRPGPWQPLDQLKRMMAMKDR
jgi:hypothetical protein